MILETHTFDDFPNFLIVADAHLLVNPASAPETNLEIPNIPKMVVPPLVKERCGFTLTKLTMKLQNLVCGKNVLIDMSIHTAYVKAIRAAQHFIYIENQYFLGSSYNWTNYKNFGANNLIPMEIALKIANKIRANERFCAYIVIPMWPEGVPTSTPTQRILFWQRS